MWRSISSLLILLLLGCAGTISPEERVQKSREECTPLSGELLVVGGGRGVRDDADGAEERVGGERQYVEEDRLELLVRLEETGRIITAIAINDDNKGLLRRVAAALADAQANGKPEITLCGHPIEDELYEYVSGYDFEFVSVTYWIVYPTQDYAKKVTVRTNYGNRILDEVRNNWWDVVKSILSKIWKIVKL